jgi:multiple sugar transport system permease protein
MSKLGRKTHTKQSIVMHLVLAGLGIVCMVPFYWLVATSLKNDSQVLASPPIWVPRPIMWSNYPKALHYIPFLLYAKNTLVICVSTMFGTVLSCSLVAYSFAKLRWPGRDALFVLVLATLMLPGQVTMIPVFAIFRWLGWIGTYKPLIVPSFLGSAFFIFLLRQFFLTIPQELSDAARVDGASDLSIYWRIILPLSRPALITVGLFTFIGAWNDFLGPLIYINDDTKYTLSIGLQQFVSQHGQEWQMLMAAATVMVVPIMIIFLFAQRSFIKGITLTGLKA